MRPPLPTEPDRFKVHNEINQCANQRFLLTAGAVALFGSIAKYLFPSVTAPRFDEIATAACVSAAYSVILAALFYQSQQLLLVVRNLSTYLRAKKWSEWEADWYVKRRNYPGQHSFSADLRAHGSMFAAMAVATLLSLLMPAYANAHLPDGQEQWQRWGWSLLGASALMAVAVFTYVLRVATRDSSELENRLFREWQQILDGPEGEELQPDVSADA